MRENLIARYALYQAAFKPFYVDKPRGGVDVVHAEDHNADFVAFRDFVCRGLKLVEIVERRVALPPRLISPVWF